MVDIAAEKEAYNQRIIDNISLIDRVYNLANASTKFEHSPLLQVIKSLKLEHQIWK